jgi:hypothetical protein
MKINEYFNLKSNFNKIIKFEKNEDDDDDFYKESE